MISKLIILLIWIKNLASFGEIELKHCRERNRLIETEKGDLYMLVDAEPGKKLTLQCHYCNEPDDQKAKIWYKIDDIYINKAHELELDMNNNANQQLIHVNEEHSLIINKFQEKYNGLYYCSRLEKQEESEKFNYLVDIVYENSQKANEHGNITVWRQYSEDYFAPINILFRVSNGEEFSRVRNGWRIEMEIITVWRSWSACQVCGMPNNQGIRKKIGFCRIKLFHSAQHGPLDPKTTDERYFNSANMISCHSQLLARILPGISNLTRHIPNFIQSEKCDGICNPDAAASGAGWKTGKSASFKYRKIVVLEQNSHLTVICPESSIDNTVQWKRNGKQLKAGQSVTPKNPSEEPRILVDTFNTLYLVSVTDSEEGNYTCEVDKIRMQQIVVYVISKTRILTQAFVRYIIYLGFILSLTLPCYLAGLVIACSRRKLFKNYEELKEMEEGPEKYRLYDR